MKHFLFSVLNGVLMFIGLSVCFFLKAYYTDGIIDYCTIRMVLGFSIVITVCYFVYASK